MRWRPLFLILLWILTLSGILSSFWVVNKLEENAKKSSRALSILVSTLLISSLSDEEIYQNLKKVTVDIDFPVAILDNRGKIRVVKNVAEGNVDRLRFKEDITFHGMKIGELRYDYPAYTKWLRLVGVALFLSLLFLSLVFFYAAYFYRRYEYSEFWAGFAKGLAHQLATPISSLYGWYEYVKEKLPLEAREGIRRDLDRLSSILRRFSKLGGDVELKEIRLRPIVLDVVSYLRRRFKNVEIDVDIPEGVKILGDAELVGWAVENFVKNSVEAGATKIRITAEVGEKEVCVSTTDNGKGFTKEGLRKAFKESFSTKQRGWGVGLTLVKKIADLHGGRVFIRESEPYYRTTVVLCLKRL